jgi:DNA repair and recombination protein RAD52
MFTEQQLKVLEAPLARERVKQRQGANRQSLSYMEGWQLIEEANRIFGFGCWSRETTLLEPLHDPKLVADEEDPSRSKVVAAYFAKARVTVWSPDGQRSIVREGCGAARGFAKTAGEAMEQAIKAAETDALKRALVTFGNAFGLALYDRQQKNVASLPGPAQESGERALDTGFDAPQRLTTSQRALAMSTRTASQSQRAKGKVTDISDLPV